MRDIDKIIVHCSATPEGRHTTVEEIRQWHLQRGWKDVGYHYVIYLDGTIHKGRPEEVVGAHCSGYNKNSIGVCYIGGVAKDGKTPKDTRTEGQKRALREILNRLKKAYPKATLHGHNEFANKACPSFNVKEEYKNL
jgi:N-acetylmuramoyl-L-alanine amidase